MFKGISNLVRTVPRFVKIANPVINMPLLRSISSAAAVLPRVGEHAPNFTGIAAVYNDFKEISIYDYRGKYVVLVFYPLEFIFACPAGVIAFDQQYEKFQKLNTEIIGVCIGLRYTHLDWINTKRTEGGLGKPRCALLFNNTHIAKDYNVLLQNKVALRSLFVIDPNGIIRYASDNNLSAEKSVEETIRIIEALQFVKEHGEANWKQGDKTIKPDQKGSKEGFISFN